MADTAARLSEPLVRIGHGDITGHGGVELWTKLKKITSKWAKSDGSWMS